MALVLPVQALEMATWNVKQMGGKNEKRDWRRTALVITKNNIDFLALQEVLSPEALMHLELKLEAISGETWSSVISEKVGTGSNEEHYAFIWRDAKVEFTGDAITYIDADDRYLRAPFSAGFKSTDGKIEFIAGNVHVRFGKNKIARYPEVRELKEYWRWLTTYVAEGRTVFIAGDFKLEPKEPAYTGLKIYAQPVIAKGYTTLSEKDGQFVYLHDNWWVDKHIKLPEARIIEYPSQLKLTHSQARKEISDHAPVVMSITETRRGLELSEEDKVDPIKVLCVNPDPPGTDMKMLHEEYLVLQNLSPTQSVSLEGYRIEDYEGNTIALGGELEPTSKAAIPSSLFGFEVWNNDEDTIYLFNPDGEKIAKIEYENLSNDPYLCKNTDLD
jgi:endonuclease/exonuclease/phosphatase family metal-dependent hydrolase